MLIDEAGGSETTQHFSHHVPSKLLNYIYVSNTVSLPSYRLQVAKVAFISAQSYPFRRQCAMAADRQFIGEQMRSEIVAVSFESFIEHYAPFQPSSMVVDNCLEQLRADGLVMPTTAGVDRFAGFQESPSRKYISKKVAYGHLSAICRSISQVVVEDRVVSCSLVQEPDSTTGSQNLEASHAIDGYVKPVTSTVPSPNSPEEEWEGIVDIAVNCEWMLPESDDEPVLRNGYAIQSRLDAVSAALHEMNNDPRRTHMYSVTIEDEAMCLWYWSRSHSAKSEAVDITKDVRSTIRGLVSFLFASTPELGYDETVQRRFDPALGGYCHIFCVGDSYFKVLRSIAEHVGPCTIAGPSTRVFEVVNVPSFDNITATTESVASPMVLKDVWLDIEAKPEKQIQNTIFGRLQDVAHRLQDGQDLPQLTGLDDAGKELLRNALRDETYRDYFLTIDCDTQGVQSKSLAPGTWREDDVFTFWDSSFWDSSSDRSRSLYVTPPPHRARSFSTWRSFVAKRQYRVVFKEVCQALHRVGDSATVFKAMKDCLLGKRSRMSRIVQS